MTAPGHTLDRQTLVEALLAPLTPHAFLADYWERDSLLLAGDRTRGAGCLSVDDVEYLCYSLPRCERDWLRLIKDGKELPEHLYATREGMVDLAKVWRAYEAGFTIQLSKMHKRWKPVAAICRALEQTLTRAGVLLTSRTGAHVYLTPRGTQGFHTHYDYHDVFVLQVDGRKRWHVHEWVGNYPLERRSADAPSDVIPPVKQDIVLEPGDLLYIPRGVYHDARATEDDHSLHITFSMFPATWVDLIQKLLPSASALRAPLPVHLAGAVSGASAPAGEDDLARVVTDLKDRLDALVSHGGVAKGVLQIGEDFLANIDAVPAAGLSQWGGDVEIGADTELEKRAGMLAHCVSSGESARLIFQGSALKGPAALVPTFEFIAAHDRFRPRDLPGRLTTDMKVRVVRELVKDGLLHAAAPDVDTEP